MVREDNLGIAAQRAATLRRVMEVCDKVKVGNFVALQTDHVEREVNSTNIVRTSLSAKYFHGIAKMKIIRPR